MKLSLEQRTKLFQKIREIVFNNLDKVDIISSDFPNFSFTYRDEKYEIAYYYNQYGMGVATRDMMQITFHDKEMDLCVKFDSGDYLIMKNEQDMIDLANEMNDKLFKMDDSETTDEKEINKVLGICDIKS